MSRQSVSTNESVPREGRGFPLLGALFLATGLALAVPGVRLALLGGSPYYVLAGLSLGAAGVLLWLGRRSGPWLFAGVVAVTAVWAVWEVGFDGWALAPRLSVFVVLALLLWVALVRRARATARAVPQDHRAYLIPAGMLLVVLGGVGLAFERTQAPTDVDTYDANPYAAGQWRAVGSTNRSERYSGLTQITPANVSRLQVAWKAHVGAPKPVPGALGALEATPLLVDDILYTCNMRNEVLALDSETGKTLWRFDPKIDEKGVILSVCRGVAYHRQSQAKGLCSARIITYTVDARMFALDARTGERCPGFGNNGEVSLLAGMGARDKGYYYLTTAPTIVRSKVVVGGSVLDGQYTGEPSGVIRAFDVLTGKFEWAWDMGRPDDHGPPPEGQTFTLGTPNAWAPITSDDDLGLAYVPLGNATPDYVAAHRSAVMNEFTDAVVAIDVETGARRWSYQTTHRDVWDYDVASPATLVEFPTPQGPRPALIQPTKRGVFFVLDRRTGESLIGMEERPVPGDPAPGETVSPTQPYPVGMPSFGGDRLTEAAMWGITPFDQLWCRIKFKEARYEGEFTPIGLRPTVVYPGYAGGSEWPGVAVDPQRQLMALNVNHFAMYDQMIPREEAKLRGIKPYAAGGGPIDKAFAAQLGTPYATRQVGFVSPLLAPCIKPPYSELAVVDLRTRKTLWRQPLGTARDSGPWGMRSLLPLRMGVPALGGPLLTGSGLLFIAATQERAFRAFELRTGRLLWEDRLPAGGHAAPMTYYSNRSGRQFVLIPASGHFLMNSGQEDYLIAYALPKDARGRSAR